MKQNIREKADRLIDELMSAMQFDAADFEVYANKWKSDVAQLFSDINDCAMSHHVKNTNIVIGQGYSDGNSFISAIAWNVGAIEEILAALRRIRDL